MSRPSLHVEPGGTYADILTWVWHRRGLYWQAETDDGFVLKIKCRKRKGWLAEVWFDNRVESSGRLHVNADLAQAECLEHLRKERGA